MRMLLSLILMVFFGAFTSYMAKQRGRDPLTWFFIGTLFGIFGLLILFILPAITAEKADTKDVEEDENAKLARLDGKSSKDWAASRTWFYIADAKDIKGPVPFHELAEQWNTQQLVENSFVWTEGMPEWKKVAELADLHDALVEKKEGDTE